MRDKAQKYLSKFGIRPSVQRIAIVELLLTHKTQPTAEEVFDRLHPVIPTLSRTTVYNTLSMLARCGAILALDLDAEQTHYDGETAPHAHFRCTRCGRIDDIWPETAAWRRLSIAAPPPDGALVADVQLAYKGLCADCRAQDHPNS